jgi:gliding motility-associated protein GldL
MMSITELVESPGYKKLMGKVYGFGAAIVLAGALFKIQHYPGAGPMLLVGMGTEIIIFVLSAFEPPHAMPDWTLVYPELVGLEPNESHHGGGKKSAVTQGGGSDLAALIQSGTLEPAVIEKLSEGIKKLTSTTNQLSDLSDANLATDSYLKNLKQASESVSQLATTQNKSVKVLEDSASQLAKSYDTTAQAITQSGVRLAEDLNASGKKFVDELNRSGETMSSTYGKLSQTMAQELDRAAVNSRTYAEQMEGMNKNISSINSMYELQLKNSSQQMQSANEMMKSMTDVKEELLQSVAETKAYKDQVSKLSHSIGELNTIYGNMLTAMNGGNR